MTISDRATTPVRYDPGVEEVQPDEREKLEELSRVFRDVQENVLRREGEARHGTHAKATALLKGTLEIAGDLPPELAQGLFARPGRHEALARFAQGPSTSISDKASGQRGLSLKVLGVDGPHVAGSRETTTQDRVLGAYEPAFTDGTVQQFLRTFRPTGAKTSFIPDQVVIAGSRVARAAEAALETVGPGSAHLRFFGKPPTCPASHGYFTQAPVRYGDFTAQLSVTPDAETLAAIGEPDLDPTGDDDVFRHAMVGLFAEHDAVFDVRVQLCTDLEAMPIEDAAVASPENLRPHRTVARLVLPRQDAYDPERGRYFDDRLAFNPIHAFEEPRPLGSIMRARMKVWLETQNFRQRVDGATPAEPQSHAEVPNRCAATMAASGTPSTCCVDSSLSYCTART